MTRWTTPSSRSRTSVAPAAVAGVAEATCPLPPAVAAEATTSAAPEALRPSTRLPWRFSRASGRASLLAGAGGVDAAAAAGVAADGVRLDGEAGGVTAGGAGAEVVGAAEPVLGEVTTKRKSLRLITTRRTRTGQRSCSRNMRRHGRPGGVSSVARRIYKKYLKRRVDGGGGACKGVNRRCLEDASTVLRQQRNCSPVV